MHLGLSYVFILEQSQVKALVKTSVLPEVAVPLQEEIIEQWQQWEREYEQGTYTYFLRKVCFALISYCS